MAGVKTVTLHSDLGDILDKKMYRKYHSQMVSNAYANRKAKTSLHICSAWSGSEVKKIISCSTQLSMKFFLLINVKMPTSVGILTFISRKNSILGFSEPEKY